MEGFLEGAPPGFRRSAGRHLNRLVRWGAQMFRFTIRDVLWLTVLAALAISHYRTSAALRLESQKQKQKLTDLEAEKSALLITCREFRNKWEKEKQRAERATVTP
jgi:polysaccharide pyruvyl transferase WcaK-like protein